MLRKGVNLKRPIIVICFFLFTFKVGAQTAQNYANAQASADQARASANAAQTSANNADAAAQDATNLYNNDKDNGASSAQQTDDYNVMVAAQAAANLADTAATTAQQDANDASAAANNGNEEGAETSATLAAEQQKIAADSATLAWVIDTNEGDIYGDPDNTIWGDSSPDDTPADITASTDQAIQGLASDPGMQAEQQKQLNDIMDLFPKPTVVQGDPDDSCR
jgi:hypothetical protein